jgi:tetratricopeptide (TPR) repeat protein
VKLSFLFVLLASSAVYAQEAKTVVGPSNVWLAEGASALLAGDAEEGIRLTNVGLKSAMGKRDKVAGLSNLCAGYAMLGLWQTALKYCDQAIDLNDRHWRAYSNRALVYINLGRFADAEADIVKGEQLAPNSGKVKSVRAMLTERAPETTSKAPLRSQDKRRALL